ncbi:MAG: Fic family protein [Gemmatimonadetes bacterium]|nr:Fic family protein [Gemmatimonadota bacterium]MYG85954.1 Fic family protein [Gemmatimonadota bacterium]MYJ89648.1 Fic family protein [Gemmatimonadota bacterium]
MERGLTGTYDLLTIEGDTVKAFVPIPLPPKPGLDLDGPLHQLLESAVHALGRLDSITLLLPDEALFLYAYVRKEAVLSSQIEGTQSSLSDLLLFELEDVPGVPEDDVHEVSNYVAAMEHGLERLKNGFPLSNRLIRETHGILLSQGRGSTKSPGEFRRSQNWIGGSRPGNALYVPPPHTVVQDCMASLERFLHAEDDGLPVLLRAGLAHVQFETIHPFLDGNGRVGRLLITMLLCHAGILHQPMLYLSLYFKQNRNEYYELLNNVRLTGNWEAWLTFFLEGVKRTADGAVGTVEQLNNTFKSDRSRIEGVAGRRLGSALRVHEALKSHLLLSLAAVCKDTGLSFQAAASTMDLLVRAGIAREITGKQRNRLYVYDEYLSILNEGTEV